MDPAKRRTAAAAAATLVILLGVLAIRSVPDREPAAVPLNAAREKSSSQPTEAAPAPDDGISVALDPQSVTFIDPSTVPSKQPVDDQPQPPTRIPAAPIPALATLPPAPVNRGQGQEPFASMPGGARLLVGYDDIGWSRYLEFMERLGAAFFLTAPDGAVGAEIEPRTGRIGRLHDPADLDLTRPFRVRVPDGVVPQSEQMNGWRTDSLTMALSTWASIWIWHHIETALRERRIDINTTAEISADYVSIAGRAALALHAAQLRGGRRVPLKVRLELP